MKEKIVFIESNTTGTGEIFGKYAKEMGVTPVLITNDKKRYSSFFEKNFEIIIADTNDKEKILKICKNILLKDKIIGIWSSSQFYIFTAAYISEKLNLPGPPSSAIKNSMNKFLQKEILKDKKVPISDYKKVKSEKEAEDAAEKIVLPVIVKPVLSSGSEGVKLCKTLSEVSLHAKDLLKIKNNSRNQKNPSYIIVEEYLKGEEYSVETISKDKINIIGITKKYLSPEPFFIEMGHDYPANIKDVTREEIINITKKSLKALNLNWGPTHTELRLTKDGPKIIEINPRLAGGMIPKLVELSQGVDLIRETLNIVCGKELKISKKKNISYTSIRFIIPKKDGKIKKIHGLEEAKKIKYVKDVFIYEKIKTFHRLNRDFTDRIGHVISNSNDIKTTQKSVNDALKKINIEMMNNG